MTGDRSLAKSDRLLSASDFSRLRTGSSVFKFSHCMVIAQTNQHQRARLGLAVSKKAGNAVRRNLLKRIAREMFRLWPGRQRSTDILIIPGPTMKSLTREEAATRLRDNLAQAFLKLEKSSQS